MNVNYKFKQAKAEKTLYTFGITSFALVFSLWFAGPAAAACTETGSNFCPDHTVVGKAPAGSFLENIALDADGSFYISNITGQRILRYSKATGLQEFASVDAYPQGIAIDADGTIYFNARSKNPMAEDGATDNANLVYKIVKGGKPELVLRADEAKFLNGMAVLAPDRILIADSFGGIVWELNTHTSQMSKFLVDPLLDTDNPNTPAPAANGLKIHDGYLYISNTARKIILRAKLDARSNPGPLETFLNNAGTDDFGFSPRGTLYLATHQDKVLRVASGKVEEFAGAETGIAGTSALAWDSNGEGPYVIGDGGLVAHLWFHGPAAAEATIVKFNVKD